MALTRSQYNKFRRTGASLGSQSSYALTLTRRQKAAEDDYYDGAYQAGTITAEQYIQNLNERLATRTWLSPLQRQNLSEKMLSVQNDYQDSLVKSAYQSGGTYDGKLVDDQFMIDRETAKLNSMVPGSEAYVKQQAIIQGYMDKKAVVEERATKDARKQYRLDQMLKISQMQEKNSTELQAKVDMYEQLQAMAAADGETQEAQQYEIQKNNLSQTLAGALTTERLREVELAASTPKQPLADTPTATGSVPTGGGTLGTGGGSPQPAQSGANVDGSPQNQPQVDGDVEYMGLMLPAQVVAELQKDSAISAANGKIARASQKINGDPGQNNGLATKISNQQALVSVLQDEYNKAPASTKEQIKLSLDRAEQKLINLQEQVDDTIAGAQETAAGMGELVKRRASSILTEYEGAFNRSVSKDINDLNEQLSKGKIRVEDYFKGVYNTYDKAFQTYQGLSANFDQLDNEAKVNDVLNKTNDFNARLEDIRMDKKPRLDAGTLRLVQYEGDESKNPDITGTGYKKNAGDFYITDASIAGEGTGDMEKAKNWDNTHVQIAGKWYPVKADLEAAAQQGLKLGKNQESEALKKGLVYYNKIADGKAEKVALKPVDYGDGITKYYNEAEAQKYLSNGYLKQSGDKLVRNYNAAPNLAIESAKNMVTAVPGAVAKVVGDVGKGISTANKYIQDNRDKTIRIDGNTVKSFIDQAKNLLQKGGDKIQQIWNPPQAQAFWGKQQELISPIPKDQLGNGTPKPSPSPTPQPTPAATLTPQEIISEAAAKGVGVGEVIDSVAEKYAPGDEEFRKVMHAIALAESSGNPEAVGDNGQSIGLYQNRKVKGRGANFTDEQLRDPTFNTDLAAKELITYYNKGKAAGLTGTKLTEYVSKYGQRPAPGNEVKAGKNYGNVVGISRSVATNEPKMMTPTINQLTPKVEMAATPSAKVATAYQPKPTSFIDQAMAYDPNGQSNSSQSARVQTINNMVNPSGEIKAAQPSFIDKAISSIQPKVTAAANNVVNKVKSTATSAKNEATNRIVEAVKPVNLQTMASNVAAAAKSTASNVFNWLKNLWR